MKRWTAIAVMLAMAASSYGVVLSQGAKELAVEGLFDSDWADGGYTDLTLFYGEYTEDNLEIGLQASIFDTEHVRAWALGVRFEYNFTQYQTVPFLALSVDYASSEIEEQPVLLVAPPEGGGAAGAPPPAALEPVERDEETVIVGGQAGLKWFIAENVAVSGAFVYQWAGADIFEESDGDFSDANASLRLGMRFFF